MNRTRFFLATIVSILVLASSCNKMPEHTRYIPKNAMAVVGINTKELSKKVAWNVLMGSKLLEEMKAKMPEKSGAAEGLGDAGVDALNTTYFYFSANTASGAYNYLTILVPLSDAQKWETYIAKNFKNPAVKKVGERQEALIDKDIFVAWDKKMAIVRKVFTNVESPIAEEFPMEDSVAITETDDALDLTRLSADMQTAFTIQKENITSDTRFKNLQTEGKDITFWLNYEVMMNQMGAMRGGMVPGLALGGNIWKDAAYTAGLDFEKGKLEADMKYYMSDALGEIYAKIGSGKIDKNMVERLPMQQVAMVFAANISTEGIKATLDKMGMLGIMSLVLSESKLTADDIFQSFTGDMAMSVCDFNVRNSSTAVPTLNEDFSAVDTQYVAQKDYGANFVFALKIKDKARFDKLLNYVKAQGGIEAIDAQTYKFLGSDSMFISIDKQFVVVSNNPVISKAYISGSYTSQAKPERVKEFAGHPTGFYVDMQQVFKGIGVSDNQKDNAMIAETKKLLKDIMMLGGETKKSAFVFNSELNFVDQNENSLLQLLNYAFKISEINKAEESAPSTTTPVAVNRDSTVHL